MKSLLPLYLILLSNICGIVPSKESYHNWAVEIKHGEDIARMVASESDLEYMGKIGNLENTYHLRDKVRTKHRSKRSLTSKTDILNANKKVSWVALQTNVIRVKRNAVEEYDEQYYDDERAQKREDKEIAGMFNDPQWLNEWYIYDARKSRMEIKEDLHVIPVWRMNITGRGVTVTIIDDGIEHTHPDLIDNYDPQSSTDINDNDDDPTPNLAPGTSNEHGTRCASEIAMVANNHICGVGIAYNAKIGGIRILDGPIDDSVEAKSLGFNNHHIDIYSASWGPADNGKSMEIPGPLVQRALYEGVTKGRKGKGNLYVWATGNGGYYNDSCGCDGYVSSMYVFSINSISPYSTVPKYAERCSSTMAATFSSSGRYDSKVISADVHGKCTNTHSGTSASAPYAAGIFALALEANPNLTWRDFKHLLAWSSQYSSLHSVLEWKKNAAGFWTHEYFGFGEIDATNLVKNAMKWVTVPPMKSCTIKKNVMSTISNKIRSTVVIDGTPCDRKVKFIEHVEIKMSFKYSYRGALHIFYKSPHGVNTTLLPVRYLDRASFKMEDWPFISVHNWGESPSGLWTIYTEDQKNESDSRYGKVYDIAITFHGTDTMPHHMKEATNNRRPYNKNYNHVKNDKRNIKSSHD